MYPYIFLYNDYLLDCTISVALKTTVEVLGLIAVVVLVVVLMVMRIILEADGAELA